jgi:hypothetical protein
MGTKNNPGKYDCYTKADPDEPLFTLRAKDPYAPLLVRLWAGLAEDNGEDTDKVEEARECARQMFRWNQLKYDAEEVYESMLGKNQAI